MKTVLYDSFKGTNDTALTSGLKDTELRESENMDFEGDGMVTRGGSEIWNSTASAGGEVTQVIEYVREGITTYLEVAVVGTVGKLYKIEDNGSLTELLELKTGATENEIDTFQIQNVLWIGTGEEIYSLGMVDYPEASGTYDIAIDDVVRNKPASSGGGVADAYYRAKTVQAGVDLATENYANATNWEELSSPVAFCRPVRARDASAKEKVKLVIGFNAAASGNVTVTLNGVSDTVAITSGDTATEVATKIRDDVRAGWANTGSGSTIYFESTATAAPMDDTGHEFDAGVTQAYGTMVVSTQGATDDNTLDDVKQCRIFKIHPLSRKIFAIGNPDDPTAVYYSGSLTYPDDPTYWKQESVVYPVTPEGAAIALVLLSDSMLVGFSNNWYAWFGVDPATDALWKMLNLPIGPLSPKAAVSTPNSFTFLARDGMREVSVNILNTEILLLQGQEVIINLTENRQDTYMGDYVDKVVDFSNILENTNRMAYHDGQVYLTAIGDQAASKILVYDQKVNGFKHYTNLNAHNWCVSSNGELIFGCTNYPIQLGVGFLDQGEAFRSWLRTKDFDLGNALTNKYLMHTYTLFKQYGDVAFSEHSVDITVKGNHFSRTTEGVGLDASFVWGTNWGAIWGEVADMMELVSHTNVDSRVFGITVESYTRIGFFGVGFSFKELRPRAVEIETGRSLVE